MQVSVAPAPPGCHQAFTRILTPPAVDFLSQLTRNFRLDVKNLHRERLRRRHESCSKISEKTLLFPIENDAADWRVDQLPDALKDRRLDLGDVGPANLNHFQAALNAQVQGIQVDFDDGHCPSWTNNLIGLLNVTRAVADQLEGVPTITHAPVIMFRPRAWNIQEHNLIVDGEAAPGPLFDFGLHMYHNGERLYQCQRGPFFYLSKLESASEALLWDRIFVWTQEKLNIPIGTIKASVLIEDIGAAFEMDEILYALRRHSAGLNCGIWDYCASIIARFGHQKQFLLPDRNKYVNMEKTFLKKYMELAVRVCRRRGTIATGGMAALMADSEEAVQKVLTAKKGEIEAGVAGFMVYDIRLVPIIKELWATPLTNAPFNNTPIHGNQLLQVPSGGVTREGLQHNIRVCLLYIHHFLQGRGHFVLEGAVEDSATAEISRWQVRQWLQHQTKIEGSEETVTFGLVMKGIKKAWETDSVDPHVISIYLRLVTLCDSPQFITTYLSDLFIFNSWTSKKNLGSKM